MRLLLGEPGALGGPKQKRRRFWTGREADGSRRSGYFQRGNAAGLTLLEVSLLLMLDAERKAVQANANDEGATEAVSRSPRGMAGKLSLLGKLHVSSNARERVGGGGQVTEVRPPLASV